MNQERKGITLMDMRSLQWLSITTTSSNDISPMKDERSNGFRSQKMKVMCWKQRLVTPNSGYQYRTKEGIDMVEYHVDSSHLFEERMRRETRYGGQLSVQREPDIHD
jgi:hypothetical protein